MIIRPECRADITAIRNVHINSFSDNQEADLVDALRDQHDAVLSLVAIDGDTIVGHVMFSRMRAPFSALGLAPVAVLADHRKKGVADGLIKKGIELAKLAAWEGMFVLGNPDYYQRFGFSVAAAAEFQSRYAGPYFMALSLQGSEFPVHTGAVSYADAFDALE